MGDIPKIPWPMKGDVPFKEGDFNSMQLHLDWLSTFSLYGDLTIADAFKEAADKIIENLEMGNEFRHPDKFFYPIAYLYRHSFELCLKCIINYGIKLDVIKEDESLDEILRIHNLHKLWNKSRFILEKAWPDGDEETLVNAERILLKFHAIDDSGQAFRYSKDIKGNQHLEKAPKRIDLINLKKVSNNLFSFLDSCINGLSYFEDCQGYY